MTWVLSRCPECDGPVFEAPGGMLLDLGTLTVVPHPDGPYTTFLPDGRTIFGRLSTGHEPPGVTSWTGQAGHRHQRAETPPRKTAMAKQQNVITMKLPVRLTESEEVQRARRLAILSQQLEAHDEEVKLYKASKHRERKPIYAAWQEILSVCKTGMEQRDVEIRHRKDFQRKVIEVVRVDTGEVVDSHPMEEGDMQDALPFDNSVDEAFEVPTAAQEATELDEEHRPRNPRKPRSPKLAVPS